MKKIIFLVCVFMFLCSTRAFSEPVKVWAPSEIMQGEPFLVQVEMPSSVQKSTLSWGSRNISLELLPSGDGRLRAQALLGTDVIDNYRGKRQLKIWFRDGKSTYFARWMINVVKKKYPREYLKVSQSMVSPPSKELARIAEERSQVKAALSIMSKEKLWSLPFMKPVPGKVSSVYGKKRYYNGVPRSRHSGMDFRATMGTPVKATNDGIVVLTGQHYFTGGAVYLDHGEGVVSMYFHLSGLNVKKGDRVKMGDVVGYSGKSGRVTGPHLHFGVSLAGKKIDPAFLFKSSEKSMIEDCSTGKIELPLR